MNNFLLVVAGIIIVIFATLFAAPYFINWNDYRSQIEAQASSVVGREVKIDGDIDLRLLPSPYVRLGSVRILDNFPGIQKPLAQFAKLTLWLSAPSLLSGQIDVQKMKLFSPVINFVVDARGKGNWENFNAEGAQKDSFIKNIALQDVEIKNGHIALHSLVGKGNVIIETADVSGQMSAHSLSGPYKFKGYSAQKGGERTLINFSTGRNDKKTGMPLNAFIQNEFTKDSYQFKSTVRLLSSGKLSYQGTLTAKIPFERLLMNAEAYRNASASLLRLEPLEIKGQLSGSATEASLKDIVFSLVRKNRPQALKGDVQFDWSKGDLQAIGTFRSRLIDADLMASQLGNRGMTTAQLLSALPDHIYQIGQYFHRADIALALDQVQAGSEVIRNVKSSFHKTTSQLLVKDFSAKLPAATYLSLSGRIEKETASKAHFAGNLLVQGADAGGFQKWLTSSKEEGQFYKPFIIASNVIAKKGTLNLREIEADLAGNTVYGTLLGIGESSPLDVKLRFVTLDAAELFDEMPSLKSLLTSFSGVKAKNKAIDFLKLHLLSNKALKAQKSKVRVTVGQLKLRDTMLNDFAIELDYGLPHNSLKNLSFISSEGLKIVVDGALGVSRLTDNSKLNVRVESLQPTAVHQLVDLFDLQDNSLFSDKKRLQHFHPLGLTIGLNHKNSKVGDNLLINGLVGSSEIFAYGTINNAGQSGEVTRFSKSNLDLNISMNNPDGKVLLKQFVAGLSAENMQNIEAGAGKLSLQLLGVAEQGMQTQLYGSLPGLMLTAQGSLKVSKEGKQQFEGPIQLEASNMSHGLALLGIGLQMRPNAGALLAKGQLVKDDERYTLSDLKGTIAGSDIYGSVIVDHRQDIPVVNADLTTQTASLLSMFEPSIDWFKKNETKKTSAAVSSESLWSKKRFDLALLRRSKGHILIKTKSMKVDQGLVLTDALFEADYGEGQLTVKRLEGRAFGGQAQTALTIKHGRAVSAVSGLLKMTEINLKEIFPNKADDLASGIANLSLDFKGSGLSPKGIMALAQGQGVLELVDTQFNDLAPSTLKEIAREEVSDKGEKNVSFEKRFVQHLSAGQFEAGHKKIELTLRDGVISFEAKNLKDDQTNLHIKTFLALDDLGLDSEWKLVADKTTKPLNMPAAILQFNGKLAQLGMIKPDYKLNALKSFLSVLKIEMDVDRLEALNSKLQAAADAEKKAVEQREAARAANSAVLNDGSTSVDGVNMEPLGDLPEAGVTIE